MKELLAILVTMSGCCFVSAIDALPLWCICGATILLLVFLVFAWRNNDN